MELGDAPVALRGPLPWRLSLRDGVPVAWEKTDTEILALISATQTKFINKPINYLINHPRYLDRNSRSDISW
jgi:hypothetical protein